jgi:DNA-binding HxlR family transcriptional regulator
MKRPLLLSKRTLMIFLKLSEKPKRPSELRKEIPGINDKLLYERLKIMTGLGLLKKYSNKTYPLEVHYRLQNSKFLKEIVKYLKEVPLSVDQFVSIISKKWIFDILDTLYIEVSPKEILSCIPGLRGKVLYQRLNELESLGLVERIIYNSKPVTVKYRLTQEGKKALPVLKRAYQVILSS